MRLIHKDGVQVGGYMRMERVVQKLMRVTEELNAALVELKKTQSELVKVKAELLVMQEREKKYIRLLQAIKEKFPVEIDLEAGKIYAPKKMKKGRNGD